MSKTKSRLGRGLKGLISGSNSTVSEPLKDSSSLLNNVNTQKVNTAEVSVVGASNTPGYVEIELENIYNNPYQPRREILKELIEDLAKSIESEGLLQPIVVREKNGNFELIAGERRLTAFKYLKRKMIPARVIEATDASSATLALIENLQRENLNPIEEALGYASLVRDFDLTQEAVAEKVGQSRVTVANSLRLLKLDPEIQGFLSRRLISTGHAKVLLSLESIEHRKFLARRIIETGMSVREAEYQVRNLKGLGNTDKTERKNINEVEQVAIRDLEKRLSDFFNTNVSIKHSPKKGRISIEYFGNDDLDRILEKVGLR